MIAHFRPIFLGFISLCLGIYLAKLFYCGAPYFYYIVLILFGVLVLVSLLYLVVKKKLFKYFFTKLKSFILILIGINLGLVMFFNVANQYTIDWEPNKNTEYSVMGVVDNNYALVIDDLNEEVNTYIKFFIQSVNVATTEGNIKLERGISVTVNLDNEEDINNFRLLPGDWIVMEAEVYLSKVFNPDYINTYAYKNNYQHKAQVENLTKLNVVPGNMPFWDSVREDMRSICNQYMTPRLSALAFSVMVGDSNGVDEDMLNNFKATGITHIIAVSGLNVAFITLLVLWFLRKIKLKPWLNLIIVAIILTFYCMICDLAPSVVRASMMAIFLLLGQTFGQQNDGLNSVSLAGLLILFCAPLYIFDLSFILSFASVFSIFMLMPVLQDLFKKWHFGKLSGLMALTVSAQIGTIPVLINSFGTISTINLIANVLLVPLFGYVYMFLFVILILALVLNFIGALLWIVQWGMWVVDVGTVIFAKIPYALVTVPQVAEWSVVSYYFAMFFGGQNCVAIPCLKWILFGLTAITFVIMLVMACVL